MPTLIIACYEMCSGEAVYLAETAGLQSERGIDESISFYLHPFGSEGFPSFSMVLML